MSTSQKPYRILSLDGGGVRGIVSARILLELERILRDVTNNNFVRIVDQFDMIAGSSTGAVLAGILLLPDAGGRAKFDANDALRFYTDNVASIFGESYYNWFKSGMGWTGPTYSSDPIRSLMKKYTDISTGSGSVTTGITLNQLRKSCLFTAWDLTHNKPHFFTNTPKAWHSLGNGRPVDDFYLIDAVMASSAAPTYFPPHECKCVSGNNKGATYKFVDGGLFANNPSQCALAEAMSLDSRALGVSAGAQGPLKFDDISIVSIGTGSSSGNPIDTDFAGSEHWGKLQWAKPLIDIQLQANQDTVDYELTMMALPGVAPSQVRGSRYVRFNPQLKRGKQTLDCVEVSNITNLLKDTEDYINLRRKELIDLVRSITGKD